ncbi:MAG: hypothetical protein RR630_10295 [Coprobacillus sp.]
MDLKLYLNKIKDINALIYCCCDLLYLNHPYIYYIVYDKGTIQLFDNKLNFISNDKKDVGYKNIDKAVFVKKENSFYINLKSFDDIILLKILIIRKIRDAFHYKQIYLFIKNEETVVSEDLINMWKFNIISKNTKIKYIDDSPVELDKNAFTSLMMSYIYKVGIRYDIKTNISDKYGEYNRIMNYLESTYSCNDVCSLFDKYKA